MSEKKSRPESRQKKVVSDVDDGRMSTDSRKKSVASQKSSTKWTDGVKRVKSAKSVVSVIKADKSSLSLERKRSSRKTTGEVGREKSSLNLDRKKSSLERKKSASGRWKSAVKESDTKTVRKFIGKCKPEKSGMEDDVEEVQPIPRNMKIWDKKLEALALKRKRVSVMDKEIGLKQIRIIPPTPLIENVAVKKPVIKEPPDLHALVLKAASPDAELMQPSHIGPRYDALGKIIPYSILGDVESFLKHSGQWSKKSDVLLVHPSEIPTMKISTDDTSVTNSQLLKQEKALQMWETEMEIRRNEQNRIAGKLNRHQKNLLMCKSESRLDRELVNLLQYEDWRHDPNVCFWNVSEPFTAGHLQESLTKSGKGQLPVPVLSGDADTILREKGKSCDADSVKRLTGDVVQEKVQSLMGTIQIANKVLFDELIMQGQGIASVNDDRGDNEERKGVRFLSEKAERLNGERGDESDDESTNVRSTYGSVFSKFLSVRRMSKVVRDSRKMMKFKGISAEPDTDFYDGNEAAGYRNSRRGTIHTDLVMMEQMSRAVKDYRRALDFRFIESEKEEVDGPALLIDGTTLQWCDNSDSEDVGCHSNNIFKEVLVLLKGEAGKMIRGYAKLENIGTTVVRYSWMRVPENKPLPVPRPRRRFFYFLDDEGFVLPKETVYVPMLFRSRIPGYFTESWLLSTNPLLEGGAKVKFIFKAIARYEPNFSQQFQEIENYLKMRQTQTLCSLQTKSIIDYALLKASLRHDRLRDDPVEQTVEEVFMQTNPGLYYHAHVIKRLQLQCKSYIPEADHRKFENGVLIVSVSDLWKAYLALPDDDEDVGSEDESYTNLTLKQALLWQLYREIAILAFSPIVVFQPSFQSKYLIMFTLLQTGIDCMAGFAHGLANSLGLVSKKEIKEPDSTQKQAKVNKNNKEKAASKSSKGGKKSQSPEQPPDGAMLSPPPEPAVEVFSAVHKFRTDNADRFSPLLAKYDEKVYLEVYRMLVDTVEEMSVLFEDM